MAGKVYAVQCPHRFDQGAGKLVPRFNFSAAEEYGQIVWLLSPTAAPWSMDSIVKELDEKLEEFDDDDFLLLVGNPALIGVTVAIAAGYNRGKVSMLQWHGKERRYVQVEADLG